MKSTTYVPRLHQRKFGHQRDGNTYLSTFYAHLCPQAFPPFQWKSSALAGAKLSVKGCALECGSGFASVHLLATRAAVS